MQLSKKVDLYRDFAAGFLLSEDPSPPRFLFGVVALNLVRNRVINSCRIWSLTQLNTPHPTPSQPHTVCIFCTLTLGRKGREEGGEP
jgi:hypothetical protein